MKLGAKIALIVVAFVVVSIIAIGLGLGVNAKNAIDTSEPTVYLSNWMNTLKDNILVKNTVIPGSHDAGTYGMMWAAETQNRTIKEQLESGSRYFDLRVQKKGDTYCIFHGPIKGTDFKPILDDICAFLVEHPTEFLILDFQKFKGDSQDDVIAMISAKLGDKLVKNNTLNSDIAFINSLTVGAVRGKCIVVWGDVSTSNHADFLFVRDNDKGKIQGATLHSYYFRKYNTLSSKGYIKKGIPTYLGMREEQPDGLFVLQCQLTDPVFIVGPKAIEALNNKNMSEYLTSFDCSKFQLNIVMRDFIGPNKCAEIINLNSFYNNFKSE